MRTSKDGPILLAALIAPLLNRPATATSTATLRLGGSYSAGSWAVRHSATIDLFNVSVSDGKIKLHGRLSEETQRTLSIVRSRLHKNLIAAQSFVPTVIIEHSNQDTKACEPLPQTATHTYFVSPWDWSNAWHFLNDAMALSHHIITTPGYNVKSRTHHDGASSKLNIFYPRPKSMKKNYPPISLVDVVLKGMFRSNVANAQTFLSRSSSVCTHIHWGVGARIIGPVDGGGFVEERRKAAANLRSTTMDSCGIAETDTRRGSPKVIFVVRSCGTNRQTAARCLSSESTAQLRELFWLRHGVKVETCCNWKDSCSVVRNFAGADIILGMHGAGLSNALFAPEGFVLVELHGAYGATLDLFRKIAQARRGGYISMATVGAVAKSARGRGLDKGNSSSLTDCAIALWKRGHQPRDISFHQVRATCGGVLGPETSSLSVDVEVYPLGTMHALKVSPGAGIDGVAPVFHDVDCVSPKANVYTCPEAVGQRPCCNRKEACSTEPSDSRHVPILPCHAIQYG